MREPTILFLQYLSNLYPELLSKVSGKDKDQILIKIDPEGEQAEGTAVDSNFENNPLAMSVRVTKIQAPLPKCLFTEDIKSNQSCRHFE